MAPELTQVSAAEYETILYGEMTPAMAAEYLREGRVCVRRFGETLRQMYPREDLIQRLAHFFMGLEPGIAPTSVKRRLENWMRGRVHPREREDFFRVAFALGLSQAQLSFLLGICTDYTIQYRNGRESVLAWFLSHGKTYQEALDFLKTLPECPGESILLPVGTAAARKSGTGAGADGAWGKSGVRERGSGVDSLSERNRARESREGAAGKSNPGDVRVSWKTAFESGMTSGYTENAQITREIRTRFSRVSTLEGLRECYLRNMYQFGSMHLRAFYYFDRFLSRLIRPASLTPPTDREEPDYSIERIMETYLSLHMPSGKDRSKYSLVQKLIKQNWPNATMLRTIDCQKADVPRKLLLLLYVVTENIGFRDEYRETDEEYVSLEERVEDHWWTLNLMLNDCGMAGLDLRNAFDWLILYAISADGDQPMMERLDGVISELYREDVPE